MGWEKNWKLLKHRWKDRHIDRIWTTGNHKSSLELSIQKGKKKCIKRKSFIFMRLNEISINKNESSPRSKTSERLPWKRRSNLAHFVIYKYIKDMYTYKQNKFCIILSIRNLLLKINPFGKTSIETLYTSSQDVLDMHPSIYENHKTIIIMHIYLTIY